MKTERLIWAGLLLVVLAWGATRRGQPAERDQGRETDPAASRAGGARHPGERVRESGGERPARRGSGATGREPGAAGGSVDSRMTRALRRTDPLERMAGWLEVLSGCDEKGIARVMESWEERKAAGTALPAEEALLNFRLGQLKGGEALAGHAGTAGDFEKLDLLKSRFEGWLEADPAGAGRWMENLTPGKFRDQMALSVIASSAMDHPEAAMRQVAALPEHLRRKAGEAAGARLRETGSIEDGSALLGSLQGGPVDGPYLNGIFETLIDGTEQGREESAARLVESHLDQPYVGSAALAKVSAAKGRADPLAALDWAVDIEEKKIDLPQGSLLMAAVQEMSLDDLAKAEQWGAARADWPGTADMLGSVEARKRILEDRGDDANEYDKDD